MGPAENTGRRAARSAGSAGESNRMCKGPADSGFAFLDISLPYVAWAAYRGVLISPSTTLVPNGRFVSWWRANLLRYRFNLQRELHLERVRAQHFPKRVSRLVGMFCFLDRSCAERATAAWGGHFRLENLAELSLTEAAGRDRLDANWVSHADPSTVGPNEDWMSRYWRGAPFPGAKPVWETLVEGRMVVLGTDLRERAYRVVKAQWPGSLMLLEISRLGAWIGSDIGSIGILMADRPKDHEFRFFLDMRDAGDDGFRERLGQLMSSGHPVNWADIGPHYERGSFGDRPDMSPYEFSCPKSDAPPEERTG